MNQEKVPVDPAVILSKERAVLVGGPEKKVPAVSAVSPERLLAALVVNQAAVLVMSLEEALGTNPAASLVTNEAAAVMTNPAATLAKRRKAKGRKKKGRKAKGRKKKGRKKKGRKKKVKDLLKKVKDLLVKVKARRKVKILLVKVKGHRRAWVLLVKAKIPAVLTVSLVTSLSMNPLVALARTLKMISLEKNLAMTASPTLASNCWPASGLP